MIGPVTQRMPERFLDSPPPPPPASPVPVQRLRGVAIVIVATALLSAGGWKLWRPGDGLTMLNRALPNPRAVRAVACLEIAVGLWLLSGKSPRLAPATAAAGLIATACLMGSEIRRERPLPCGCFPVRAGPDDTAAVRQELAVSIGRNAFLVVLCGVAMGLTAGNPVGPQSSGFDRVA